jgi:hypothetical protein
MKRVNHKININKKDNNYIISKLKNSRGIF